MRRGETVTGCTPEARATADIRYRRIALTHKKRCCEKEKVMEEVFFSYLALFFFPVDLELTPTECPEPEIRKI